MSTQDILRLDKFIQLKNLLLMYSFWDIEDYIEYANK